MRNGMNYLCLPPESNPPSIPSVPSRFLVIADVTASVPWVESVCRWIVGSGCLYMMAWGRSDMRWEGFVDRINDDEFAGREVPVDRFILTTTDYADDKSLSEFFSSAKIIATHPDVKLVRTVILHISATNRQKELLWQYQLSPKWRRRFDRSQRRTHRHW